MTPSDGDKSPANFPGSPYARPAVQDTGADMSGVNNFMFGCLGSIIVGVWELIKGIVGAIFS